MKIIKLTFWENPTPIAPRWDAEYLHADKTRTRIGNITKVDALEMLDKAMSNGEEEETPYCETCQSLKDKMTLSETHALRGHVTYRREKHILSKLTKTKIETLCGAEDLPPNNKEE